MSNFGSQNVVEPSHADVFDGSHSVTVTNGDLATTAEVLFEWSVDTDRAKRKVMTKVYVQHYSEGIAGNGSLFLKIGSATASPTGGDIELPPGTLFESPDGLGIGKISLYNQGAGTKTYKTHFCVIGFEV